MRDAFRLNNFDLLRLGAALQVALEHAAFHLEVQEGWWGRVSLLMPGVPIFFFISGFLISRSYESNSRLDEYFRNRGLRIYPALVGAHGAVASPVPASGGQLRHGRWFSIAHRRMELLGRSPPSGSTTRTSSRR